MNKIQKQFPLLGAKIGGKRITYFDNAATSQKPRPVIDAMTRFYERSNANVHRSMNPLAEAATEAYEGARAAVAEFINASHALEVAFTRGTTESINAFAFGWARTHLRPGDAVAVPITEHHSNLVPWLALKQELGIEVVFIEPNGSGRIGVPEVKSAIDGRAVKLLAIAAASNTLGTVHPIREIAAACAARGVTVFVDAAQAAPHMPIDVRSWGVDAVAFSGHKMYGPTGIGVLWCRRSVWESMQPFMTGGHMIREVFTDRYTLADLPHRFEAGTPPIAEAVGLHAAIQWIRSVGWESITAIESALTQYLLGKLSELPFVTVYGPREAAEHLPLYPFAVAGVHPHDIADLLGREGICIRAGHHCSQPLHQHLQSSASARVSLGVYNTPEEIELFAAALKKIHALFN